jgi:hypothetical protein
VAPWKHVASFKLSAVSSIGPPAILILFLASAYGLGGTSVLESGKLRSLYAGINYVVPQVTANWLACITTPPALKQLSLTGGVFSMVRLIGRWRLGLARAKPGFIKYDGPLDANGGVHTNSSLLTKVFSK